MEDSFDFDVFLSFSVADKNLAEVISLILAASGLRFFFSDETISNGLWLDEIRSALSRSKHLVLITSPAAEASVWVRREYRAFLKENQEDGKRSVIPLVRKGFTISSQSPLLFLDDFQACRLDQPERLQAVLKKLGGQDVDPFVWKLLLRLLEKEEKLAACRERASKLELEVKEEQEKSQQWRINGEDINNPRALRLLADTVRNLNKIGRRTSFSPSESDMVTRYLISHHIDLFAGILHNAIHKQTLPLPSVLRREVAIETIRSSSDQIVAVSMWEQDPWLREKEDYWKANVAATERGILIRRVVVVKNPSELSEAQLFFEPRKIPPMAFRYALEDELKKRVSAVLGKRYDVTFRNVLICVLGETDVMTRSTPDNPNHDGELSLDYREAQLERALFEATWDNAD